MTVRLPRATMDRIQKAITEELAGLRSALEGAEGDERLEIESRIRVREREAERLGMEV